MKLVTSTKRNEQGAENHLSKQHLSAQHLSEQYIVRVKKHLYVIDKTNGVRKAI